MLFCTQSPLSVSKLQRSSMISCAWCLLVVIFRLKMPNFLKQIVPEILHYVTIPSTPPRQPKQPNTKKLKDQCAKLAMTTMSCACLESGITLRTVYMQIPTEDCYMMAWSSKVNCCVKSVYCNCIRESEPFNAQIGPSNSLRNQMCGAQTHP